jgi:hypothetical protein
MGKDIAVVSLLRQQFAAATGLLEQTMDAVTPEQAHWVPARNGMPIAAHYGHVVVGQDGLVNGLLRQAVPLCMSSWSGRTGLSELPPGPDPQHPGFPDWSEWARRVRIDLAACRAYARAVYDASDAWLASIGEVELARELDLSVLRLPRMTVQEVLSRAVIGNALLHTGEISTLKGLQGTRGYPV